MHHDDPPVQPKKGKRAGTAGGILVTLLALGAKFKSILLAVTSLKWFLFAPKILLSFGSIIASVWLYALFWGWKFGLVFVALLAVHELGHYLTFRNFGIPASLPLFIPGLGAFVSSPMSRDPARNAIAAIMGPVFGVLASAVCWGYGLATGEPFWIAAAYVGFFLNLFNLIPAFPLDGGRVAGAIDARLWLIGVAIIIGWVILRHQFSAFFALILVFVVVSSIPRAIAAFRGRVDPTMQLVAGPQRAILAIAYFALLALAGAGAAATNIPVPTQT